MRKSMKRVEFADDAQSEHYDGNGSVKSRNLDNSFDIKLDATL